MRRLLWVAIIAVGLAGCGEVVAPEGPPELAFLIIESDNRVVSAVPDTFRVGVPQIVGVRTEATSCFRAGEMVVEEVSENERRVTPYNIHVAGRQAPCLTTGIEHTAWVHFDVPGLARIYIHGIAGGLQERDFEYEVVVVE